MESHPELQPKLSHFQALSTTAPHVLGERLLLGQVREGVRLQSRWAWASERRKVTKEVDESLEAWVT